MFHCHNLIHEDHDMLGAFNVTQLSKWGYTNDTLFIDPMEPAFRPKNYTRSVSTEASIKRKISWFYSTNPYNKGNVEGVFRALSNMTASLANSTSLASPNRTSISSSSKSCHTITATITETTYTPPGASPTSDSSEDLTEAIIETGAATSEVLESHTAPYVHSVVATESSKASPTSTWYQPPAPAVAAPTTPTVPVAAPTMHAPAYTPAYTPPNDQNKYEAENNKPKQDWGHGPGGNEDKHGSGGNGEENGNRHGDDNKHGHGGNDNKQGPSGDSWKHGQGGEEGKHGPGGDGGKHGGGGGGGGGGKHGHRGGRGI